MLKTISGHDEIVDGIRTPGKPKFSVKNINRLSTTSCSSDKFDKTILKYSWLMHGILARDIYGEATKFSPVIWNQGIRLSEHSFKISHHDIIDNPIVKNVSHLVAKGGMN